MRLLVTLALLAAAPQSGSALADTLLSAQEFDALTQGRTMTWAEFGQVYGVEQYLPGRKVRWTVLGDDCMEGQWFPQGPAICFLYDGRVDPVCWEISAAGAALHARLVGNPPGTVPVEIVETTAPLACFGPEVGV